DDGIAHADNAPVIGSEGAAAVAVSQRGVVGELRAKDGELDAIGIHPTAGIAVDHGIADYCDPGTGGAAACIYSAASDTGLIPADRAAVDRDQPVGRDPTSQLVAAVSGDGGIFDIDRSEIVEDAAAGTRGRVARDRRVPEHEGRAELVQDAAAMARHSAIGRVG